MVNVGKYTWILWETIQIHFKPPNLWTTSAATSPFCIQVFFHQLLSAVETRPVFPRPGAFWANKNLQETTWKHFAEAHGRECHHPLPVRFLDQNDAANGESNGNDLQTVNLMLAA